MIAGRGTFEVSPFGFVHVEVLPDRSRARVAEALAQFLQAFGAPVHTILTEFADAGAIGSSLPANGSEFTDRFVGGRDKKQGSGAHPFNKVCAAHGIVHRLIRPYSPQTNGMVERFNRRLSEAMRRRAPNGKNAGRNRFHTHEERNLFIHQIIDAYNRTRLKCLNYKAPLQCLINHTEECTSAGIFGTWISLISFATERL